MTLSKKQNWITPLFTPNNFEKQKVQLVVNVFNEKTVAKSKEKIEMAGISLSN